MELRGPRSRHGSASGAPRSRRVRVRTASAFETTTSAGCTAPEVQRTATARPLAHEDLLRPVAAHDAAPAALDGPHERLDDRVGAAVGVPDAVGQLQVGQRGVHRRHAEGVAADVQRVEAEGLVHVRLGQVAARERRQVAGRPQPQHRRQQPQELRRALEGLAAGHEHGALVDAPRGVQEVVEVRPRPAARARPPRRAAARGRRRSPAARRPRARSAGRRAPAAAASARRRCAGRRRPAARRAATAS